MEIRIVTFLCCPDLGRVGAFFLQLNFVNEYILLLQAIP